MTTNKKKIFVTESMSQQGRALLHARDDIELVEFPNMISAKDFETKLKEHAPVHGVALGGTRFGEPALFMMLTLAKRAVEMHSIVRDNKWPSRLGMLPYDLFGKTVLIVGFGRIGTRTAKRCLAMEMNVLVYDPYKAATEINAADCEQVGDLDAALPRADFVSIHCPKTSET